MHLLSIHNMPHRAIHHGVHGRMARDGRGLPKVSLGSAMPFPIAPYRQTPLKQPYDCVRLSVVAARSVGHLWPSSTPLDTPRYTPLPFTFKESLVSGRLPDSVEGPRPLRLGDGIQNPQRGGKQDLTLAGDGAGTRATLV
jgi:hypothetical protein